MKLRHLSKDNVPNLRLDLGSMAHKANQITCHSGRHCALYKLTMCCRRPDQLTSEKEIGRAVELDFQVGCNLTRISTNTTAVSPEV